MSNDTANPHDLVEHLFRREYGRLSSTLARVFGLDRLGVVEDIVQEALLTALKQWSFRGVPTDPTAWLHRVARNKALDHLRHERVAASFAGAFAYDAEVSLPAIQQNFLDWEIEDSQLRMIFACCDPGISSESQIALTLKTLCGFSVQEIASAFLTSEATIEKRLQRARKFFRENRTKLEPPSGADLVPRLSNVLASLYLLFNEGYKRSHSDGLVQRDLLLEALRLALLVSEQFGEEYRAAYALVSLMLFHVARLDARTGSSGEIVLLSEQDRALWNPELIQRGLEYSVRSSPQSGMSHYHIEAAIQAHHALALSFEETDWAAILGLYKRLYEMKPNPIVLLHMSVSVSHLFGNEDALALLNGLPLEDYYLYHALRGDYLLNLGKKEEASIALKRASELSLNAKEKALLEKKIERASR